MPDIRPIIPAKPWFWSRLGLSIITTPAKPVSTVTIKVPCRTGRGDVAEGRQASSVPPTRKAAIHTLLM